MAISIPLADFRTIPDDDYRKQWALLNAEMFAAAEDGFTSLEQKHAFITTFGDAYTAIRDTDDKNNLRGLLAIRITEARKIFRDVMGETWRPTGANTVAAAARARGLTL